MVRLDHEFRFYLDNQNAMVEKYDGKVVAIKGGVVLGVYDSYLIALTETAKDYEEGTFLLQRVSEGEKDYATTFHSRVAI